MNSHGIADFAHELQAVCADQLPACVIAGGSPTVPTPPSLTLAAFATEAYVRETDTLVYADQDAHSVTLTGADGIYWLAISTDTWTSYAQWTTENGTKYRWRPNATQPADVAGLLTFASVTVAGGAVTAVSPLTTVTRAAAGRALLALGTMATQNANAVAITGGGAVFTNDIQVGSAPALSVNVAQGRVAIKDFASVGFAALRLRYARNTENALFIQATDADTGGNNMMQFNNIGGSGVGSITTTATATAYNTASDIRLKERITPLTGALDVIQALNPIAHIWKADGSPGVGFRADEVQQVVADVVTGEPGAVNEDGTMAPQMMDYSKLVPYLVSAVQALLARLEVLEARLPVVQTPRGGRGSRAGG